MKELLRFSLASSVPMALSSDFGRNFTPVTMPSRVSLSAPVESRIVSSSMVYQRTSDLSLSNVIAVELRERSPRQASQFRDKARHFASSASIGAHRRPTRGTRSMIVSPHSCMLVVCAGSATSCRSLLDSAVSRRLL